MRHVTGFCTPTMTTTRDEDEDDGGGPADHATMALAAAVERAPMDLSTMMANISVQVVSAPEGEPVAVALDGSAHHHDDGTAIYAFAPTPSNPSSSNTTNY